MEKPLTESVTAVTKDSSSEAGQPCTSESIPSPSVTDAQRCMSLYFALCTKVYMHTVLCTFRFVRSSFTNISISLNFRSILFSANCQWSTRTCQKQQSRFSNLLYTNQCFLFISKSSMLVLSLVSMFSVCAGNQRPNPQTSSHHWRIISAS